MSDYVLVSVVVPSTIHAYPVPKRTFDTRVKRVLADVAAIVGGATAESAGQGAWVGADGQLVVESVVKVWSFAPPAKVSDLLSLFRRYAADFSQEAVLAIVGDAPVFLSA